jgi:hypothetical protein
VSRDVDRRRTDLSLTAPKRAPVWLVGLVGSMISVAIVLPALIRVGFDPSIFLALGDETPIQTEYARRLLGDVVTRPDFGHDGKFFFAQANDPWYLEPELHAAAIDWPIYRGQRMLYPMIAGGFGFLPPGAVAWSMLVTNLVAMGLGALLGALLATRMGVSPWLGLAIPLNVGLIFEVDIGGAGVFAYVFCLGAVYALAIERDWLAAFLLGAGALTREVMVAFAVGLVVLYWLGERRLRWRLVITPLVAMAVWQVYLQIRVAGWSGIGGTPRLFSVPFVGMLEAIEYWTLDPLRLILVVAILAAAVRFVPLALRSRSPIAWGALPFVALTVVLSVEVWREPFDLSRALAPALTALPFLVLASNGRDASISDDRLRRDAA